MPNLKYAKTFALKADALQENRIAGNASVYGTLDSYDDVIMPNAFSDEVLAEFLKTGFVAANHDWREAIAMPLVAEVRGNDLYSEAEFHSTDDAQAVRTKCAERIDRGLSVGLSIGFMMRPGDYKAFANGPALLKWAEGAGYNLADLDTDAISACNRRCQALLKIGRLIEWSVVSLPANPEAWASEVKVDPAVLGGSLEVGDRFAFDPKTGTLTHSSHTGVIVGSTINVSSSGIEKFSLPEDSANRNGTLDLPPLTFNYHGAIGENGEPITIIGRSTNHTGETPPPSILKGEYLGPYAEAEAGWSALVSLTYDLKYGPLYCALFGLDVCAGQDAAARLAYLQSSYAEYSTLSLSIASSLMEMIVSSEAARAAMDEGDEDEYLEMSGKQFRAFIDSHILPSAAPSDLPAGSVGAQAETALAAAKAFHGRMAALHTLRTKEGRTLSEANRARLQGVADGLTACAGEIVALLDETAQSEKRAASDLHSELLGAHLLARHRAMRDSLAA